MKVLSALLLASSLLAGTSQARDLAFTLPCSWSMDTKEPVGAPRYEMQKLARKAPSGKWSVAYHLKVIPLNPTASPALFALTPAGSGDEDYNEYNVVDLTKSSPIAAAYIQNSFKWVTLIDQEGVGSYDCRKSN